ncbi:hypothetical protein T484DRAFT_1835902 [Baffinella frigidus]|nr:hypothetical protein T484DRAFT_1835902 [Cryptophyta sp. CCMP2293]
MADEGAMFMATLIANNSTLTSLDLSANHIADDGAMSLGEALVKNSTLVSLNVSWNRITDQGLTGLAAGLRRGAGSLQKLNVHACKLGPKSGEEMIPTLMVATSLTELSIHHNEILYQHNYVLESLVQNNAERFNIRNIPLDQDTIRRLRGQVSPRL